MLIAAPTALEKNHPHLWRFWNALPKDGMAIFDRTWYGRVMVEHMEGFCTDEEWAAPTTRLTALSGGLPNGARSSSNSTHRQDEQLARFTDRQNTPEKQYKITDEDWRNRDKWDELRRRSTRCSCAPTPPMRRIVVESNDKRYARSDAQGDHCGD
ncbi:MAG: hypothetical protein ACLVL7_10240 [Anaerotruncus massiliensis (ex Togo et al. 2019)]